MSLIECTDLTLGYDQKAVVSGLNFTVNQGDYLCVVGENGSGKTTLIKALLHLHGTMKGKITFGEGLKPSQIGYLPQQTAVQKDFPASVFEVVLTGCLNKNKKLPFYTKSSKKLALANMERLSIAHLKNKCYRELSGGQQQRVLLARALCATEKLLLLDEATAGLDPKVTAELYELIKALNDNGITVIMISHDIAAAKEYATHILHIGDSIYFGTKDEYFENKGDGKNA